MNRNIGLSTENVSSFSQYFWVDDFFFRNFLFAPNSAFDAQPYGGLNLTPSVVFISRMENIFNNKNVQIQYSPSEWRLFVEASWDFSAI